MWKLSNLIHADNPQSEISKGVWIPARPLNEDYKPILKRIKEAWAVFVGKASAFIWD